MPKSPSSKVMDVSKPGQTKPDASSKPVIVGHRPMVADPMVSKEDDEKGETIEVKKNSKPFAQTGKKIEPVSADMKPQSEPKAEAEKEDGPKEEKPAETEPAPAKPEEAPAESKPEETPPAESTDAAKPSDEKAKTDAATKEQEAAAERQAKIQELIDSKKYFVKIDDSKTSSIKTFVLTVLAILLVGALALAVLVDADILDLGIGLPFDLIK